MIPKDLKWVEKFPGYWTLICESGIDYAVINRGRVSLMCKSAGKEKQFDNLFHKVALWRAKKWCERQLGR